MNYKNMRNKVKLKSLKLSQIFFYSALFFAFFSFFGVYEYTIYSIAWFIMFFVYELIFYAGLKCRNFSSNKTKRTNKKYEFVLTETGANILLYASLLSIVCFAYFIFLYRSIIGVFAFGVYTAHTFQEGRTALEKFTLFLMHMGSETAFLICSVDKTPNHKKLKALTHITLFLPGLRYLLMGARFTIAVEYLLMFAVKWPKFRARSRHNSKIRRRMRIMILIAIVLGIAFCYLFASRAIYYTALERQAFNTGDMRMKPFWRSLYDSTDGKIDFLCTASDYLGEAPYIFSYFCRYRMPKSILWGQITFRSISQILTHLFPGIRSNSSDFGGGGEIASGQYSGVAYILIADFGFLMSFIVMFLFGHIFALVEKNNRINKTCTVILPAVKVMCFFAPIFYFYVGRLDYVILFCLFLCPICLRRCLNSDLDA